MFHLRGEELRHQHEGDGAEADGCCQEVEGDAGQRKPGELGLEGGQARRVEVAVVCQAQQHQGRAHGEGGGH